MSPDISHPLDDVAVYALDALDEAERTLVDAHLITCAACRAELDQHLATLSHLATPDEPPPELWDRIVRQTRTMPRAAAAGAPDSLTGTDHPGGRVVPIEAARQGNRPRTPPPGTPAADTREPRHRPRHHRPPVRPPWLAAVAAVAVVLAGIAGVVVLARGGDDDAPTVAELAQAAADDPSSTVVRLRAPGGATDGAEARIVTTGDPTGYVLLDDLPEVAEGHTLQVWGVDDPNVPVSLGVIGDGSAEAAAIAVPEGATSFAITDEPVPEGVPAPTGPMVVVGTA
jgi:anti-sigma-K factor RskA